MSADDLPPESVRSWSRLQRLAELVGDGRGESYFASLSDDEIVSRVHSAVPRPRGRGEPLDLAPFPGSPYEPVERLTDSALVARAALVREHIVSGYVQGRTQAAVHRPHLAPAAGLEPNPPVDHPPEKDTEDRGDEPGAPSAQVTTPAQSNGPRSAWGRVR